MTESEMVASFKMLREMIADLQNEVDEMFDRVRELEGKQANMEGDGR